jgi:hypothetical protein
VLGLQWGNNSSPPSAVLTPSEDRSTPASTPGGVDEFAVPGAAAGWLVLLDSLYDRRASAFAAGDVEGLAGVYTANSSQALADRAEIERLSAMGQRVDGFDPDVISVESARGNATSVTLVVTDSFGPYAVIDDQRLISAATGRAAARVEVSLQLTPAGWRIDSAVRLAGSG